MYEENIPSDFNSTKKEAIGVSLSGGATRGLAHIGVLQALEDNNIRPDYISGTSIGSFAAAFYAFGIPLKDIRRVGKSMTPINVSKLKLSRYALFSNEELGKLIQAEIGKPGSNSRQFRSLS